MRSKFVVLYLALLSLSGVAFSQNHADLKKSLAPKSDAQVSFETLKSLAGTWTGLVTVDPPDPKKNNKAIEVTMRVTSSGNAIVHEGQEAGTPLDPTKFEHPVTMLYLDGDRLTPDALRQCFAFHKFEDQETRALRFLQIVNRGDVRVIERSEHFGFTLEAMDTIGIARELLR